jgi:hypothetical protein
MTASCRTKEVVLTDSADPRLQSKLINTMVREKRWIIGQSQPIRFAAGMSLIAALGDLWEIPCTDVNTMNHPFEFHSKGYIGGGN